MALGPPRLVSSQLSIIYRLSSTVYRLSSTVYRLWAGWRSSRGRRGWCRLSTVAYNLSSIVYHRSSVVYRLPSIVYGRSSVGGSAVGSWPPRLVSSPSSGGCLFETDELADLCRFTVRRSRPAARCRRSWSRSRSRSRSRRAATAPAPASTLTQAPALVVVR